jgi:predicted nuclease of predicted toxin-antitoxin system
MSAVRLYFDADSMERAVVMGLRARGVDATTSQEAGTTDRTDEEQLKYAGSQGRVLFSFNASDFCRIHTQVLAEGKSHAGIILAPQQRYSIGERIRHLLKLIAARSAADSKTGWSF